MANWNTPSLTDLYTNFLLYLKDRDSDLAKSFDPAKISTYPTNLPTDSIRWNSAMFRWEIYNGTVWSELLPIATAKYSINVDKVDGYDAGNASGNIPVSNSTVNTNLNADMVDGYHAGNAANQVLVLDASAYVPVANLTPSGIAAASYRSVTVDLKGRVTAGTNPTTIAGYGLTDAAPINSPTFTGTPLSTTPTAGDNSTKIATTAYAQTELALKAPLASPAFSGTITTSGIVVLNGANAGFEVGSLTAANAPYFDFHSSGNNIDYDARIIASGGSLTTGQGALTYSAATHTFNGTHTVNNSITSSFLTDAGADNYALENTSVAAVTTKFSGIAFKGRDTTNVSKFTGYFRAYPSDNNYAASFFSWFLRTADAIGEKMRLYGNGRLVIGSSLADNGTDTLQVNGSAAFTGNVTGVTQAANDSSTKMATTAYADTGLALKANLSSPAFTGTPSLPTGAVGVTQTSGDSTTKLATTAFVSAATAAAVVNTSVSARQAVQYGPNTAAGLPDLITQAQVGATLATGVVTNGTWMASVGNGFNADGSQLNINRVQTSSLTFSNLAASTTNYLIYNTNGGQASYVTLADIFQAGGTISGVNNQVTYDYLNHIAYSGNGTNAGAVPLIVIAEVDTNATVVTAIRVRAYAGRFRNLLSSGLALATTSGTSKDFTGIPSWAKRITIMLTGINTNSLATMQIQIGSGSIATTGYVGCATSGGLSPIQDASGFVIVMGVVAATDLHSGVVTLVNISGNTWVQEGNVANNVASRVVVSAGHVVLSGILDRVRFTTANGTVALVAGSVNILVE